MVNEYLQASVRACGSWRTVVSFSAMKAYRGSRGRTPLILTWAPVGDGSPSRSDRFTQGQERRYLLNRRLGWPQNRSGSSENKNLLPLSGFELEMSLQDVMVGLWCAMRAAMVTTSILAETTNSHPCITHTRAQLLGNLAEYDRTYVFFLKISQYLTPQGIQCPAWWMVQSQNDNQVTLTWHPPDPNQCDFYLQGTLNDEVYWNNPPS